MDKEKWSKIEELFHHALELTESQRADFFVRCGSPSEVTAKVRKLLAAHETGSRLLDAPAATGLPEGTRLGAYELLRMLGSGGMGTVYLARRADHQFEKQVAVKFANRGLTETISGGRLERERKILASLEHPNIAHLLDAGLSGYGQPYLVMEWVDGVTLDAWIQLSREPRKKSWDCG